MPVTRYGGTRRGWRPGVACLVDLPLACALLVPVAVVAQPGETPIHVAAMCGHLSVVRLLVRAGASIDARNKGVGTTNTGLWP